MIGTTVTSKVTKRSNKTGKDYCKVGDSLKVLQVKGDYLTVEKGSKRFVIHSLEVQK